MRRRTTNRGVSDSCPARLASSRGSESPGPAGFLARVESHLRCRSPAFALAAIHTAPVCRKRLGAQHRLQLGSQVVEGILDRSDTPGLQRLGRNSIDEVDCRYDAASVLAGTGATDEKPFRVEDRAIGSCPRPDHKGFHPPLLTTHRQPFSGAASVWCDRPIQDSSSGAVRPDSLPGENIAASMTWRPYEKNQYESSPAHFRRRHPRCARSGYRTARGQPPSAPPAAYRRLDPRHLGSLVDNPRVDRDLRL